MSSSHSPVTLGKLTKTLPFTYLQKWAYLHLWGLIWILNEISYAENIACYWWPVNGFLSPLSYHASRRGSMCNLLLSSNAVTSWVANLPFTKVFLASNFNFSLWLLLCCCWHFVWHGYYIQFVQKAEQDTNWEGLLPSLSTSFPDPLSILFY